MSGRARVKLSLGIPQIASIGLGAVLISVVSYRVLLVAVAAVAVLAAGYLLSVPETRRRGAVAASPAAAAESPGPARAAASDAP